MPLIPTTALVAVAGNPATGNLEIWQAAPHKFTLAFAAGSSDTFLGLAALRMEIHRWPLVANSEPLAQVEIANPPAGAQDFLFTSPQTRQPVPASPAVGKFWSIVYGLLDRDEDAETVPDPIPYHTAFLTIKPNAAAAANTAPPPPVSDYLTASQTSAIYATLSSLATLQAEVDALGTVDLSAYSTTEAMNAALALKAPLASPAFTDVPTAPTAAVSTNTTQLATTAFVLAVRDDLIANAPGQLDTLAELADALQDGESVVAAITTSLGSLDTRVSSLETNEDGIITSLFGKAEISDLQTETTTRVNNEAAMDAAKIGKSLVTTKGDLIVATASATVARMGVGSNGQILCADSAETLGMKWAAVTVSVGGITGLGTGVAAALVVNTGASGSVMINGGAITTTGITLNGHITPGTSAAYDIGSPTFKVRAIYASSSVNCGTYLVLGTTAYFQSTSAGVINMYDNGTGTNFKRLNWGQSVVGAPGLRAVGSDLEFCKGNNTVGDCAFIISSPNGTRYRIAVDNAGVISATVTTAAAT